MAGVGGFNSLAEDMNEATIQVTNPSDLENFLTQMSVSALGDEISPNYTPEDMRQECLKNKFNFEEALRFSNSFVNNLCEFETPLRSNIASERIITVIEESPNISEGSCRELIQTEFDNLFTNGEKIMFILKLLLKCMNPYRFMIVSTPNGKECDFMPEIKVLAKVLNARLPDLVPYSRILTFRHEIGEVVESLTL